MRLSKGVACADGSCTRELEFEPADWSARQDSAPIISNSKDALINDSLCTDFFPFYYCSLLEYFINDLN
jgi:hypothetical protein